MHLIIFYLFNTILYNSQFIVAIKLLNREERNCDQMWRWRWITNVAQWGTTILDNASTLHDKTIIQAFCFISAASPYSRPEDEDEEGLKRPRLRHSSSSANASATSSLNPSDPGFINRARVPQPPLQDYVVRPNPSEALKVLISLRILKNSL